MNNGLPAIGRPAEAGKSVARKGVRVRLPPQTTGMEKSYLFRIKKRASRTRRAKGPVFIGGSDGTRTRNPQIDSLMR